MTRSSPSAQLLYWLLALLTAAVMGMGGFGGRTLFNHESRLSKQEQLAADIDSRLTRIESKLDAMRTAQDGTAVTHATSH